MASLYDQCCHFFVTTFFLSFFLSFYQINFLRLIHLYMKGKHGQNLWNIYQFGYTSREFESVLWFCIYVYDYLSYGWGWFTHSYSGALLDNDKSWLYPSPRTYFYIIILFVLEVEESHLSCCFLAWKKSDEWCQHTHEQPLQLYHDHSSRYKRWKIFSCG